MSDKLMLKKILDAVNTSRTDILARVVTIDQLATDTAHRLDDHIKSSGGVHRDLRGRLAVAEAHIAAILRRLG